MACTSSSPPAAPDEFCADVLWLLFKLDNWMAPWKNQISSTTMKLRKSLVKPVTRQNISSSLVLPPEIIMHNALMLFSQRPPIYASSCMTISGGRTKKLDIIAGFLPRLWVIFIHRKCPLMYAACMTISGGRTKQHVVIGFRKLAAVDRICRHSFSILTK